MHHRQRYHRHRDWGWINAARAFCARLQNPDKSFATSIDGRRRRRSRRGPLPPFVMPHYVCLLEKGRNTKRVKMDFSTQLPCNQIWNSPTEIRFWSYNKPNWSPQITPQGPSITLFQSEVCRGCGLKIQRRFFGAHRRSMFSKNHPITLTDNGCASKGTKVSSDPIRFNWIPRSNSAINIHNTEEIERRRQGNKSALLTNFQTPS